VNVRQAILWLHK